MPIAVCFAKNRALVALERNPGNEKPKLLGMAAERHGNRVADRNPRRQADVLIRIAGTGDEPVAALGQHARAAWLDGLNVVGLPRRGRADNRGGEQQARNPGS